MNTQELLTRNDGKQVKQKEELTARLLRPAVVQRNLYTVHQESNETGAIYIY
jgi:hypothetical protein